MMNLGGIRGCSPQNSVEQHVQKRRTASCGSERARHDEAHVDREHEESRDLSGRLSYVAFGRPIDATSVVSASSLRVCACCVFSFRGYGLAEDWRFQVPPSRGRAGGPVTVYLDRLRWKPRRVRVQA